MKAGLFAILLLLFATTAAAQRLPSRLSDEAFWQLMTDLSEAGGQFPSENFVSNELLYQYVLPNLKKRIERGGVYVGVGPEQNFNYIATLKPRIAFIVDIRRQNLIEHLMYKAVFELSTDRRDFLSRLFSRRLPPEAKDKSSLEDLLMVLRGAPADASTFAETLAEIKEHLTGKHGFKLTPMDLSSLEFVFRTFHTYGTNISYNGSPSVGFFPTYAELLLATGLFETRDNFLSSDDNFRFVQKMHKDNMIVPLVGDFAGDSAIRKVGDYLRKHDAAVSVLYASNVEQYLFADPPNWEIFYRNLGSLPRERNSVIVRTTVRKDTGVYSASPGIRRGYLFQTMLFSLPDLVSKFDADGIRNYGDVLRTGNLTIPNAATMEVESAGAENVGVIEWPNLRPPSRLQARSVSSSEIRLEWPNTGQGDKTGFRISMQVAGEWIKPIHVTYASVCGSDPCVYRDSNLKKKTRYCYFVQAATDHANLGPVTIRLEEEFGEPSITVCSTLK